MTAPRGRGATRLAALTVVAALATAIVAYFLLTQPRVGLKTPGRAFGSLLGLAIWASLAVLAGARWSGRREPALRGGTTTLSILAAAGSVGLAAIHVAAGVGGWETLTVAVLGVGAAGLGLAARTDQVSGSEAEIR